MLPVVAVIMTLTIIVFVLIGRNSGTKKMENTTKTTSTNIVQEEITNEPSSSDMEKENQERLRKEKEEQDKQDAEKLRLEREAQAKQEAERLRKAKEEQDKRDAEKLRQEREAQAKLEAEKLRKEKEEQDRLRKEKEEQDRLDAANFLQQANSTFKNSSLGTARLDQSFQLYMKAKEKGGDVTEGYRNFMSVAQTLIGGGAGFDSNVKKLLEYAQKLNNTQEVRDLLEKCK